VQGLFFLFFISIGFPFLQLVTTDCSQRARQFFTSVFVRFNRIVDLYIFTDILRGLPTSIFQVQLGQDTFLQILSPHRLISSLKTRVLFCFSYFISCTSSLYYRGDESVHCLLKELHQHQNFAPLLPIGRRHVFFVAVLAIISCVAVEKAAHTAPVACPKTPLNSDCIPFTEQRNL